MDFIFKQPWTTTITNMDNARHRHNENYSQ